MAVAQPLHSRPCSTTGLQQRARRGIHLLISGAVAACAAGLVFGLWYPGIYRLASGGRDLFCC